jgi:hypothetical protein
VGGHQHGVSAASGRSFGRGTILKGLAWLGCVLVLLSIATTRAASIEGRDVHFKQGYVLGTVLVSLAVGFAIWVVVQHVFRKRSGFPPWIGVIAIGVSCLLLVVDVGNRAAAQAACVPAAKSYGPAPAGWTYAQADAPTRAQILELMKIDSEPGVDVRIASHRDVDVILVAVPNVGPSYVAGADSGAREAGATVSKASYGPSVHDHRNGSRVVVGPRGCNVVWVVGRGNEIVDTVARSIFS